MISARIMMVPVRSSHVFYKNNDAFYKNSHVYCKCIDFLLPLYAKSYFDQTILENNHWKYMIFRGFSGISPHGLWRFAASLFRSSGILPEGVKGPGPAAEAGSCCSGRCS